MSVTKMSNFTTSTSKPRKNTVCEKQLSNIVEEELI